MTALRNRDDPAAANARGAANTRTALILGSIALVFFFGVMVAQYVGTPAASFAVLGAAVLLYLCIAIGRHLRR
jgi:hypothetical protein